MHPKGIEGPTANKAKMHNFDRSRPGQQYKIRSPRIPSGRGMEANSDRETGEINSTPITVTTDTMPLGELVGGAEGSATCMEATEKQQQAGGICGEDFGLIIDWFHAEGKGQTLLTKQMGGDKGDHTEEIKILLDAMGGGSSKNYTRGHGVFVL